VAGKIVLSAQRDHFRSLEYNFGTVTKVESGSSITRVGEVGMVVSWTLTDSTTDGWVGGLVHILHQKGIEYSSWKASGCRRKI